jgi:hypothetical protein
LIVSRLLRVTPKESLVTENGVGSTPQEITNLAQLIDSCKDLMNITSSQQSQSGNTLSPTSAESAIERIPVSRFSKYEAELMELTEVVPAMIDRGTAPDDRKLHIKNEIRNWADKMTDTLRDAKEREKLREAERRVRKDEEEKKEQLKGLSKKVPYLTDKADVGKTFELITKACEADSNVTQPRHLIHVLDVQKSVGYTLAKVNPKTADNEYDGSQQLAVYRTQNRWRYTRKHADFEELEGESEPSRIEIRTVLLSKFFSTPDPW